MERGSQPGRYRLEIYLKETRPYFLQFSGEYQTDDRRASDSFESLDFGFRHYIGSAGMLFVGASPDRLWNDNLNRANRVTAGYAHYNLFNRNVFASLQFSYFEDLQQTFQRENQTAAQTRRSQRLRPEFLLSVPLFGNHWFKAQLSHIQRTVQDDTTLSGQFNPDRTDQAKFRNYTLAWEYNTTDDDLLPGEGRFIELEGGFQQQNRGLTDTTLESNVWFIQVDARQHWPLFSRQSVFIGAEYRSAMDERVTSALGSDQTAGANSTRRIGLSGGAGRAGYAFHLLRGKSGGGLAPRDLRFQVNAEAFQTSRVDILPFINSRRVRENGYELGGSLITRGSWGILRLSYTYTGSW